MNKGFTLIELLAVIVILAIILVISVPQINNVITDSKMKSFESDAKIILSQLDIKSINKNTDITTINETNIESILGIKDDNYDEVIINNNSLDISISIVGKNKWEGLAVYGTYDDIKVATLPTGLVGEWKLNGNANDSSENNSNGVVYSATLTTDNKNKSNSAYSFDGINDYISIPYSSFHAPTDKISYGIWVYKDDWSILYGAPRAMFSKTEVGGYNCNVDIEGGPGYLACILQLNGSYKYAKTSYLTFTPGWHFVMCTYDGRYIKLYVDGILKDTNDMGTTYPIQYMYNNNLFIGCDAGYSTTQGGLFFVGKLDNAMVYNKTLTDDEIKLLYNIKK